MFRFNPRSRVSCIIPILLLLTMGGALNGSHSVAWAQQPQFERPTVSVQRGFNFGSVYRSTSITVDYRSAGAAFYQVRGARGRAVRLIASAAEMRTRPGGSMTVTLINTQCAYSLDNGNTWKTFTTGPLRQELRFPDDDRLGPVSTILVRIGGRVDCAAVQQRGRYEGSIRLNALYISDEELSNRDGL